MNAIIFAAGNSTRFGTKKLRHFGVNSKCLLKLGNNLSVIENLIIKFLEIGIKKIFIVVKKNNEYSFLIEKYGDNIIFLENCYTESSKTLTAAWLARVAFNDATFVCAGDVVFKYNIFERCKNIFNKQNYTSVLQENNTDFDYIANISEELFITSYKYKISSVSEYRLGNWSFLSKDFCHILGKFLDSISYNNVVTNTDAFYDIILSISLKQHYPIKPFYVTRNTEVDIDTFDKFEKVLAWKHE